MIAKGNIPFQAAANNLAQLRRNTLLEFRYRNHPLLGTFDQAGQGAVGVKGCLPGQQFIENKPQRKNVGALVQIPGQCLLRRHIFHGADHGPGLRHPLPFERLGKAKIHNQDAAATRLPHNVLRLQVAVDDADIVRRLQRPAYLLNHSDCFARG